MLSIPKNRMQSSSADDAHRPEDKETGLTAVRAGHERRGAKSSRASTKADQFKFDKMISNIAKKLIGPPLDAIFQYRDLGMRLQMRRLHSQMAAQHILISAVSSVHDSPGKSSDVLLELGARLIDRCRREELPLMRERNAPDWVFCWPGEHYRLLASLVSLVQPMSIVEIGTNTGLSALAMCPPMAPDARLCTFDIVRWDQLRDGMGREQGSFLRDADFEDGRLRQVIGDPGCVATYREYSEIFGNADLIFVDGPKDGSFEKNLLRNFERFGLKRSCLVIFDDIRYWTMLAFWREIERPKLDLTSFGHFAGTGLVLWE
jgi:predicted O-methyltransferase YrrM